MDDRQRLTIDLKGHSATLFAERALYLPASATLAVADLHWGKAYSFQAAGLPVPAGSLPDDLARLGALIRRTGAERLLLLGDVIHDHNSLNDTTIDQVGAWRREFSGLHIALVRGNHDRWAARFPDTWGIEDMGATLHEPPFIWAHEPEPIEGGYVLGGHLHPTVDLRARSDALRLPCFHFGPDAGILPAFTTFSNGLRVARSRRARTFVIAEDVVIDVSA